MMKVDLAFKFDDDDKGFTLYLRWPDKRIVAKDFAEPFKAEGITSGRYIENADTWPGICGKELETVKNVFQKQNENKTF